MKKLLLFIVLVASIGLHAQTTHTVINTNDAGLGSLRAAADSCVAGDTIRLSPLLIANGSDSIVLTSGDIDFDSIGVVIKGVYTVTDTLFISGNDSFRIFSFTGAGRVVLDSLVLRNGNGYGSVSSSRGGAIYRHNCTDTLFIRNSSIINNKASFAGGGIYSRSMLNSNPTAICVINSLISGNMSKNGGGIYSYGNNPSPDSSFSYVFICNSTISNNIASNGSGGGVFSFNYYGFSGNPDTSYVKLINSTVSNNSATVHGGGIYVYSAYTYVDIINSTLSGNSANYGGGVSSYARSFSSTVSIVNATISRNLAFSNLGGGIYAKSYDIMADPSYIYITSSIVAENGINTSGIENSRTPTIISNGNNIFNGTPWGNVGSDSLNTTVAQLNLQPLAFNGGRTQTMLPGIGSVAINNGNPNDSSDAQNIPVIGRRDAGAAEFCARTYYTDLVLSCASYYTWMDGNTYTDNNNTATHTINNSAGCDSLITLNLILRNIATIDTVHACDSVVWIDGQTYFVNQENISDTLTNSMGCDSVVYLHFIPSNFGLDERVVCDSLTWINGVTYYANNNSANDTLISLFGCDSVVTLNLIVNHSSTRSIADTACGSYLSPSGQYVWTNSGTYLDTLQNAVRCDSIITINLVIIFPSTSTIIETACDSFTSPSGRYVWTSSNTYLDTIPNSVNCDSVIAINLTVVNASTSIITDTACINYVSPSGRYVWASSGTYLDTISNSMNCDSIITINLTVKSSRSTDVQVACGSYTWINGITYYANTTTAKDTLVNAIGCDSIVTLNLTINPIFAYVDTQNLCDSLTWIDGITYYSNNSTATFWTSTVFGCDSIITLDLTLNNSVNVIDSVSACSYYQWSNGQIYVSDNSSATQVFLASNGCDSIVTLNLEIHNGSFATDTHVVCDSLLWMDGNTYYSDNNTAIHNMIGGNSHGCDSVVTLNLTVNSTYIVDVVSSCSSYTWIDGITYTSNNNTARYTTINSLGCNSIVTLNLTILNSTSSIDVITSCNPITWMDGITYTASNSTATQTGVNTVGCDSIITLDFTLLTSTSFTDVITSCTPITWIDGITYDLSTNNPTFTISNNQGCDSVVTLDFTLLEVDTSVTRNYLTLTAQANNATYQWINCDNGRIAGETNASFTATVNGNYQVDITQNGCVDTSACYAITNVGIGEAELIGVSLYPNPTSDVLHIDKGSNKSLDITITNSAGAIVHQSTSKNQVTSIDMAKMATGMYVVTLKNELGLKVEKVVKR